MSDTFQIGINIDILALFHVFTAPYWLLITHHCQPYPMQTLVGGNMLYSADKVNFPNVLKRV